MLSNVYLINYEPRRERAADAIFLFGIYPETERSSAHDHATVSCLGAHRA